MLKLALLVIQMAIAVAYSPLLGASSSATPAATGTITTSPSTAGVIGLPTEQQQELSRRKVFGMATTAAASLSLWSTKPTSAHAAESTKLVPYEDPDCNFSLVVPDGWIKSVQEISDRRKIVLYVDPTSNGKTLLFFAYTPVRDDYTSLSSFGSVDQVAQMTILPKGEIAGQDNASAMLSAEAKNQAYVFDYKQTVPQQPETHFRTIFSMVTGATGGAGAVLVTITAQTPEAGYDAMKPMFDEIISSYKLGKK